MTRARRFLWALVVTVGWVGLSLFLVGAAQLEASAALVDLWLDRPSAAPGQVALVAFTLLVAAITLWTGRSTRARGVS